MSRGQLGLEDEELEEEEDLDRAGKEEEVEEEQSIPLSELKRRLARVQEKHEEELRQFSIEKKKEVKKAKMTQAEKRAFDIDDREKALVKREHALNNREIESSVISKLGENKLPDTFADLLIGLGDEELIDSKIEDIKKSLDAVVNKTVKDKIGHPEPEVESKKLEGNKRKSRSDIFSKR